MSSRPAGFLDVDVWHPTGNPGALASGRLSPLLALEIPLLWRPAPNRRGPARAETPNAFTRLKYIVCLEKHTCDHVKIWIRRSVIFERALTSRANRKPNPLNLNFA